MLIPEDIYPLIDADLAELLNDAQRPNQPLRRTIQLIYPETTDATILEALEGKLRDLKLHFHARRIFNSFDITTDQTNTAEKIVAGIQAAEGVVNKIVTFPGLGLRRTDRDEPPEPGMEPLDMTNLIKGNTGDFLTFPSPLVGEGDSRSESGEGASLLDNAKKLRSNMTEVEKKLWYHLRAKRFAQYKFRRQVPMQKYIADFVCYEPKIMIELDGGQHTLQADYDKKRDAFFVSEGSKVLRFWNNEVIENMDGVLTVILNTLKIPPLPSPLPQGERGQEKVSA